MAGGYLNVPTDEERHYQQRIVDSNGQAGPTLQRIADLDKTYKNNTGILESLFESLAPLGMYSGDAEGAYIPSSKMKTAQGLAKVFQDWYKGGTPTINVPFERWGDIIKSGKFKNQMEIVGRDNPKAWTERTEIEKKLGGYPYPRIPVGRSDMGDAYYADRAKSIRKYSGDLSYKEQLEQLKELMLERDAHRKSSAYSETLVKQNPIYGHIYNTKYTQPNTADAFGDTYAEMSDLVKDQSKYVLGDSFNPFIKKAFSSDDMLGNTSRLERSLFGYPRDYWKPQQIIEKPQNVADFMEMWIPNHLARLNNIKSVHVPGKLVEDTLDRAVPVQEIPNLLKQRQQSKPNSDFFNPLHEHLFGDDDFYLL